MLKRLLDLLSKRECLPPAGNDGAIAVKYRHFKSLLHHNRAALNAIAGMEQLYYAGKPFSLTSVRIRYEELLEAVTGIIYHLEALSGKNFSALSDTAGRIDSELFRNFNPKCEIASGRLVVPIEDITPEMKKMVGEKAANLAAAGNLLKLPVPPGFSITAYAFEKFIGDNKLLRTVKEELSHISSGAPDEIERASGRLREMILQAQAPPLLEDAILEAYGALEGRTHEGVRLAMRSSAVGEDTEATFAGQYETVLNVRRENILEAYKSVLASKYSARAISYRLYHGLDDRETPMCVAGIAMIDAKASGVLYSVDPSSTQLCPVRINSLWGIGEHLVDGSASPDVFIIDRKEKIIRERHIARKESKLTSPDEGGTRLEHVPEEHKEAPSLDDATAIKLAGYGLLLEEFFERPQDVEWALDADNELFILQSRPLHLHEVDAAPAARREYPGNPMLLSGGKPASRGIAAGRIVVLEREQDLNAVPGDAILVVKTASPGYAKAMGRIRGIITDVGSVASHLASVAREFGIPALMDTGNATSLLKDGEVVTLSADRAIVYKGVVEELAEEMRPARKMSFDSPLHRRMKGILDRISPLNLTDVEAASFSPGGCRTFHDIVRFTHECAMREMFGLSVGAGGDAASVELVSGIPLGLRIIDMGGGLEKDLKDGLSTCDRITPDRVKSIPLKAIWNGFTHPGVNWTGTMRIASGGLSALLAASAASEVGAAPIDESYAIVSGDYLNLNVRFAYHFAAIDTLCGEDSAQNYLSLQFSGGAGSYYGRSLRIHFMGNVLERLGFRVSTKGELLDASIARYDRKEMEERLDLMGRLLASSRLLDITVTNQEDAERYAEEFLRGKYDFLPERAGEGLEGLGGFYFQGGYWKRVSEEGHVYCVQDGAKWGRRISLGISGIMNKVLGGAYREFLDNIEAYYYFPLAVVKGARLSNGAVGVRIKPVSGNVDRAGGIAFGIENIENYFVLRTNALEHNIALFEYRNGKRFLRSSVNKKIETGRWHHLKVVIEGASVKGYLDDVLYLEYLAERPPGGLVGLWTKADSVTWFDELTIEAGGESRIIGY
ncbi:MAG TPA: PEP/pyruvate-binding domain-containing protein [Dissulfurispiraceae bacterium]